MAGHASLAALPHVGLRSLVVLSLRRDGVAGEIGSMLVAGHGLDAVAPSSLEPDCLSCLPQEAGDPPCTPPRWQLVSGAEKLKE